jgi:uncharacterized protein (DUF885 family)
MQVQKGSVISRGIYLLLAVVLLYSCQEGTQEKNQPGSFDEIGDQYWEERMQLFPLEATANGDNRYNDRLTITISNSFRDSLKRFYTRYLQMLDGVDSSSLSEVQKTSLGLFRYEMSMNLEGLKYPTHYMPINQFWSLTLDLPTLGSGLGNQPFKTEKDYRDFLKRLSVFPAWTDTAIANMRSGIEQGWVLPATLVEKILPQLNNVVTNKPEESIFYGPIQLLTDSIRADKAALTREYTDAIVHIINPSYAKLYDFLKNEYLPHARKTSGLKDIPGGMELYNYNIRYWTTTNLSPDSIYNIGLSEVDRITKSMEEIREKTGFKGTLKQFFEFLNTDPQFYPFTTEKEVLDSFWAIKKQEDPYLKKAFNKTPSTPFTIRQTEAFRAASASAEYNPASEDGSRPGIFYVPILNPKKFNAVGMETLFLHEAIPGHHYQISLQQENKGIPKFRRFLWYGAYGEGWALYSESLGTELGLFKNPYQYFGHLSDGIHRAIRLVVDVGIHAKGMTREDAIKYMVDHERISEEEAAAEIERYMAIPGQALSYKIGELSIRAEREKYEKQLGPKFSLAAFHDEVLARGCLPLNILQNKLAVWAETKNR